MFESSIRTIKEKNMEYNSLFVEIVWFISFVWPCLDDSDDIRDLQWRIKCPRNFRPSPWILPRLLSYLCPSVSVYFFQTFDLDLVSE